MCVVMCIIPDSSASYVFTWDTFYDTCLTPYNNYYISNVICSSKIWTLCYTAKTLVAISSMCVGKLIKVTISDCVAIN